MGNRSPEKIGFTPEVNDAATRLTGIKEKLARNEAIYDPEILREIREEFFDKDIAVIDVRGVLSHQGDTGKDSLNPDAAIALQFLKDNGFNLILWSSGPRKSVESFLEENNLWDFFSLSICEENYVQRDTEGLTSSPVNFCQAVKNTPWLTDNDKKAILEPKEDINPLIRKLPQLLFRSAIIFDDNIFEDDSESAYILAPDSQFRYPPIYMQNLLFTPDLLFDVLQYYAFLQKPNPFVFSINHKGVQTSFDPKPSQTVFP